jgi:hypothetical protein
VEVFDPASTRGKNKHTTPPPTHRELRSALKQTKGVKAPGIVNIIHEVLKADINITDDFYKPMFRRYGVKEKPHRIGRKVLIVKFPKKEDPTIF